MVSATVLIPRPYAGFPFHCEGRSLLPRGTAGRLPKNNQTISKGFRKADSLSIRNSSFPIRAVAVDSNEVSSSETITEEKPKKYHFLVANAKFMLDEEEHFQELLFEKLRNYGERKKEQDFWLLIEPKLLGQFPDITKRLKRPAVALVSTDDMWIRFMKLRLDRVLSGNYVANSMEEALASNDVGLDFGKPEKWVAPYPKYEFGWWGPFLPPLLV